MFRIGEFSKITQVSIRMLRYYDEHDLLKPESVDPLTGYRMYRAEQIEELNRVVLLRNMGFGVKKIKELLNHWNTEQIKELLNDQILVTENNIRTEQNRLGQIRSFLTDLEQPKMDLNIQVIIKELPVQQVISLRRIVPDYYCEGQLWQELGESIPDRTLFAAQPSFSIYHDLDYREQDVDIEVCVVAGQRFHKLADNLINRQVVGVDEAACFMVYGPYSNISPAYKEFAFWLQQHPEYKMSGENRQICHRSMCHTDNPEEYITELQIPLLHNESYCNT